MLFSLLKIDIVALKLVFKSRLIALLKEKPEIHLLFWQVLTVKIIKSVMSLTGLAISKFVRVLLIFFWKTVISFLLCHQRAFRS
ncbi:hypothetical protein AMR42_10550 [Limnothrix sp. PR1529]|nr:hypothetical protein BCR12_13275 [Limnothrix sp. P13C2]PIB10637.1 hypothetical protein AMR42_10550 [Limnothrix sp. PR1529]